jgi:hypothetical protein
MSTMSVLKILAVSSGDQVLDGKEENPKPGREGMTTLYDMLRPCPPDSDWVRRGTVGRYSRKDPE